MRLIVFLISFHFVTEAWSQLDPASSILLNQQRTSTRDTGIDSGRYTVKPRDTAREPRETARENEVRRDERRRTTPRTEEQTQRLESAEQAESKIGREATATEAPQDPMSNSPRVVEDTTSSANPPLQQKRRENILEISVAPTFIYNDSSSSYTFRNYHTASPGFFAEARVWLNPTLGVQGSYGSSLGAHVRDSLNSDRNVALTHQWLSAGVRTRRFSSDRLNAPSFSLGLDYREYQFQASSQSQLRVKTRTSGPAVILESDWPTSARRSLIFDAYFMPKSQHRESDTQLQLRSGSNVDTSSMGISVGTRLQIDRVNAIYFKLSHSYEKNLFSGAAGVADPRTGTAPVGVSVQNSMTLFQFGYAWGN